MPEAVVAGVGEAPPVRKSGLKVQSHLWMAIDAALNDAGISAKDIDGVITESELTSKAMSVDTLLPALGIGGLRYQGLSGPWGSGILLAVAQAHEVIRAGLATHVLTYFGVDWGSFGTGPVGLHHAMKAKASVEYPIGFGGPQLYFATVANRYAHEYHLDRIELTRLLGSIVISARRHAMAHPQAQQRNSLTMAEYESEPYFAEPLRRSDISLLSDGAVAIVISDASLVRPEARLVTLEAWAHRVQQISDESFYTQSPYLPALPAATQVAEAIRSVTGSRLANADAFELYDCFSIATVMQLEALGVTEPGATLEVAATGGLCVGGGKPTNTHGGLLAHGYLLGGGHIVEAVRQLRHEAVGRQVADACSVFVGAGPGRQYTGLLLRRTDD